MKDAPTRPLIRLGAFAGGCTLNAVEAVFPSPSADGATLDHLATLVDHSLVRQQEGEDEQPRFWMLETLLEFARERLVMEGEEQDARRRHADYFLALAETAEHELQGPAIVTWLGR